MRIVRPYGRSHVERGNSDETKRVLRLRDNRDVLRDLAEFACSHDELIIAQWISAIDKIATKPFGNNGPTDEQRELRKALGNAAWAILEKKGLLPGLKDGERKERLAKLWEMKTHPYGEAEYKPRRGKQGRDPSAKAKWYARFTGDVRPSQVNARAVAEKIYEHLHAAEYRFHGDGKHEKGRIAHRAASISHNVLHLPKPQTNSGGWSDAECEEYKKAGNVAEKIRDKAKQREARTRRVKSDVAAAMLYEHYERLFPGDNGKVLSIAEARSGHPGLFALHMAVKDCYSRILKHNRKKGRVSTLLPGTMDELFRLLEKQRANRDLNALVRLGKIVHYEINGDIERSRFWGSDGQAQIKRNEAFVRVWRHSLSLANRTLTDWADPKGKRKGDILGKSEIDKVTGENFKSENYRKKLDLLFGERARFFKNKNTLEFEKDILRLALEKTAILRNHSFHFRKHDDFITALTELGNGNQADKEPVSPGVLTAIGDLWETDLNGRAKRLRETLEGAHSADFLDKEQSCKLLTEIWETKPALVPIPRFNRILQRAENAWKKDKEKIGLPAPAKREKLEASPARRCQYTTLKLLYERPFRAWLEGRDAETLNSFIKHATERSTRAAQDINARKDSDLRKVIVSRADRLPRLAEDERLETFFFNLSAETASEMRVQRGYDPDADKARKQAGFIEDLKCDVVALAFKAYLNEAEFNFLLDLSPEQKKPENPLCRLDEIEMPKAGRTAEDWQKVLYFLIHLVPVDDIGRLLHQIRKWEILAEGDIDKKTREKVRPVQLVFDLYLDMHDAKFEGGEGISVPPDFEALFEDEDSFKKVFRRQSDNGDDRHIPRRGLREIMRFGHLPVLLPVFKKHPVTAGEVNEFLEAKEKPANGKSKLAELQETREKLHKKWVKEKSSFSDEDKRAYAEALQGIVLHRYAASHVTLTDHVRLHRLLMAVLGRLLDYSGLWERDLYFVTLALIHQAKSTPEFIYTEKEKNYLRNGQIIRALRMPKTCDTAKEVNTGLQAYFGGAVWEKGNRTGRIRSNFAHFNMLQTPSGGVDLTACVNDARELMAYDRKLKNAVSQSVKELLHREGLELEWTMETSPCHRLGPAKLKTRQIPHLGGKAIYENLHGDAFVNMAAALFCRGQAQHRKSIVDVSLDDMDGRLKQEKNRHQRRKKHRRNSENSK
jgi:hypothetical protein